MFSHYKVALRLISFVLSLVILFYATPMVIYAELSDAFSKDGETEIAKSTVGSIAISTKNWIRRLVQ